MGVERIEKRFSRLRAEGRAGLVTFTTAGDPTYDASLSLLKGLPGAGVDLIELGMPFSDPMADGPAIQAASLRALKGGMTLRRYLDMIRDFREGDQDTPLIMMGYYNPIYIYGVEAFLRDAVEAGVDGLIIVDLPPEEDAELAQPAARAGMGMVHLATPTTDAARLKKITAHGSGFLYYVSIAGVTGTREPDLEPVKKALAEFRGETDLPLAVGFGIKTPANAAAFAEFADAVVVGSAIVDLMADLSAAKKHGAEKHGSEDHGNEENLANPEAEAKVLSFVKELARGVREARRKS